MVGEIGKTYWVCTRVVHPRQVTLLRSAKVGDREIPGAWMAQPVEELVSFMDLHATAQEAQDTIGDEE